MVRRSEKSGSESIMSDTGETRPEPALLKLFPSRDRGLSRLYSQRSRVGTKKLQSTRTDQGPSTHQSFQSVRRRDGPLRRNGKLNVTIMMPVGCLLTVAGCGGRLARYSGRVSRAWRRRHPPHRPWKQMRRQCIRVMSLRVVTIEALGNGVVRIHHCDSCLNSRPGRHSPGPITRRDNKRFLSHGFCHCARARPSLRFSGTPR